MRYFSIIFSFYILISALVPCSVFDNCREERSSQQGSGPEPKKDCSDCPPFCTCSSAHGFTSVNMDATIEPFTFNEDLVYGKYTCTFGAGYSSSPFQPPRTA